MNIKTNKVIFSVFQSGLTESENLANHGVTREFLKPLSLDVLEVTGMYLNKKELSFLIQSSDYEKHLNTIERVLNIASDYNQDAILTVENDGQSFLRILNNGESVNVGIFTEVSQSEAEELTSYTEIDGRYFTTKE